MSEQKKPNPDWAAAQVAKVTKPMDEADAELFKAIDEAVSMLRISFSGVDVTKHLGPVLPPELRDRKREP